MVKAKVMVKERFRVKERVKERVKVRVRELNEVMVRVI